MARRRKSAILPLFLHPMQQKWDQGTLWRQKSTVIGSRTRLCPQWTMPWPSIHQTWSIIYWLYLCILCNKNWIKGLWGQKGQPSSGVGPALVLQWTLPWPYNTPDMALYILAIFLHSMPQKWDQGTLGTHR